MGERYVVETVVRGYHVYMAIWETAVGQILPCQHEVGNIHDPYAVELGIVEGGAVVGHVPRAVSSVCYLFLRKNGTLLCSAARFPICAFSWGVKNSYRPRLADRFGSLSSASLDCSSTRSTSLLAAAILELGTKAESGPSGFGRTELRLKYLNRAIAHVL